MRATTIQLALAASVLLTAFARAEPHAPAEGVLMIELNALKANGNACRMALAVSNGLDADIEALGLELVVFDANGIMERVLRVKASDLPSGRMRIQLFNLENLDCTAVGKLLVNEVTNCTGAGLDTKSCAKALSTSHRTDAPLLR